MHSLIVLSFFFFNDTATTEIYTLSLHDALPIYRAKQLKTILSLFVQLVAAKVVPKLVNVALFVLFAVISTRSARVWLLRSEEHTSELQSRLHLVCRLLLEKKNTLSIYLAVDV